MTLKMQKDDDNLDDIHSRDIIATKNRFGSTAFVSITMKENGFDFSETKKEDKDILEGKKEITTQEAIKLFGTYYNAKKYLEKTGFVSKDRGVFVRV
jgi:hypothetical protein